MLAKQIFKTLKICIYSMVAVSVILLQYRVLVLLYFPNVPLRVIIPVPQHNFRCFAAQQNVAVDRCKLKPNIPPVYIITPTYPRAEQHPAMVSLSHTLMQIPNLIWLVFENSNQLSPVIKEVLEESGICYTYETAPMPAGKNPDARGVSQRLRGLQWLRANATNGVFYFADDDNTYTRELFDEIRYTRKLSMFPVGLIGDTYLRSPILAANGTHVGYNDGWLSNRIFPIDMAGFAVSVQFLLQRPNATMLYAPHYEETLFVESLMPFDMREVQFLGEKCTQVRVWKMKSIEYGKAVPLDLDKYRNTNIVKLRKYLFY